MSRLSRMCRAALARLSKTLDAVVVAAMCVVAVAPFGRLYSGSGYLFEVGLGVVVVTVLAYVLHHRDIVVAVLAEIVALTVFLVFVTFSMHTPSPSALGHAWDLAVGSAAANLHATIPADETGSVVALPMAIAWLCAMVGVELALRVRAVIAPVVSPIVGFAVSLLFVGAEPPSPVLLPGLLLLLTLMALVLRANRPGESAVVSQADSLATGQSNTTRGHVRVGFVMAVALALVAVLFLTAVPFVSSSNRFDLRHDFPPGSSLEPTINPLADVGAQLRDPQNPLLFKVRMSGSGGNTQITRIPIAVLDSYNGVVWRETAPFEQVGSRLPQGSTTPTADRSVLQQYQLERSYSSILLPALGVPTGLQSKRNLYLQPTTGMLATLGTTNGLSYSVTSAIAPSPSAAVTAAATAATGSGDIELPLLQATITEFRSQVDQRRATAGTWLNKLDTLMRSNAFGYQLAARPGQSVGRISDLLGGSTANSANAGTLRIGTAEQFVAAFAILARSENIPTRVVVGYKVPGSAIATGGWVSVREHDATAWDEVDLRGLGWVTFDPTNPSPRLPPQLQQQTTQSITLSKPTNGGNLITHGPGATGVAAAPKHRVSPGSIALIVLLALVVLTPVAIIILKRWQRKQRSSTGTVAQRTAAAWRQMRAELRVSGIRVTPAMTVAEAADVCANRIHDDIGLRVREFGPLVDLALFSPDAPDESLADKAWKAEGTLVSSVRDHESLLRRARSAVDPRPLISSKW